MYAFCLVATRPFFGRDIANSIFDLEISRSTSWPRWNPMVTFETYSSIDMLALCFVAIRPFFCRDISNSIFDLEISRSTSWPMWNPMVTFETYSSIDMLALCFVAIRLIFGRDIANFVFDLENSRSRSRPKSNQVIYRPGPSILPNIKEIWKFVQKLSREQHTAASAGGGASGTGGGVRTGSKTKSPPVYRGDLINIHLTRFDLYAGI